jgi:Ca-activated chloride channel homolog
VSFLTPAALALAILLPVVIAMYLLKLRRVEQVVPSVYLWRRTIRDVEANAPWQRLRRNLLLLLQLLFLAAMVLALARPFTWRAGIASQAAIFILDVSASMAATDVTPNRMEAAKSQAIQLVNGLPEGARITVIAAGEGAQVLVASTQDRRVAHQAIEGIRYTNGSGDLTAALQLASAIAARQPDTEIVILSDGRVTLPQNLAVKGRLRYLPAGISGENQAISLLSLESAPGGSLTAFAQVTNYGKTAVNRRLELYADGDLLNAYALELPARSQRAVLADDLPDIANIEARLTDLDCPQLTEGDCPQDALPLDDRAWAVYRITRPAAVTLVTQGNRFLETALALLPNLEVTLALPEEYDPAGQTGPAPDLTIFDGALPGEELPAGGLFIIAPPRSTELFTITGTVDQPQPRPVSLEEPLLANISLSGINILDAAEIPLPGWARPVIAGDTPEGSSPLLFAGEVEGRRAAVLAFDLHHSDLPLNLSFPLLLANLTGWLAPGQDCALPTGVSPNEGEGAGRTSPCIGGSELPAQILPGEAVAFTPPLDAGEITLTRPDGSRARVALEGGQVVLGNLEQLGVYHLDWGTGSRVSFAANLFLPGESDIQPLDNLPLTGDEGSAGAQAPQQARQEWWRALAFLALAFLLAEWLVYQRTTLGRLIRNVKFKLQGQPGS